jgi:hypothetical protein
VLWVGIHRANFADFILDLRNCYSQLLLYIWFTQNTDLWILINYFFLVGNWVVSCFFECLWKCWECLKTLDSWWTVNTKEKEENLIAEMYSLLNLYIIYKIWQNIFCLWMPTRVYGVEVKPAIKITVWDVCPEMCFRTTLLNQFSHK